MEPIMITTKKGQALKAKMETGVKLNITRVVAGKGRYQDLEDVASIGDLQTVPVGSGIHEFAITSHVQEGTRSVLYTLLTNKGLTDGYDLTIFAVMAEDPDEGEIVYRVSELQRAFPLSSEADFPSFAIDCTFSDTISNASEVIVAVDPAGVVTGSQLDFILSKHWRKDELRRANWKYPLDPAQYIYVATTGSDESGDGTEGKPYATLGKAVEIGSLYTKDSYVQINVGEGDYYEPGLSIIGAQRLIIAKSGATNPKLHLTGMIPGTAGTLQALSCAALHISGIDFSCDYVMSANPYFLYFSESNVTMLDCDISSSVAQNSGSTTEAIRVYRNSNLTLVQSSGDCQINGFHVGVLASLTSEATVRCQGEVLDTAYSAGTSGTIFVDTSLPPILAPQSQYENSGGRVRFSHLQGVNNTITIYADPNGDDRNWGQSAAYPVKTLARARDIAQRCEGTGILTLRLADGTYHVTEGVVFTSVGRLLTIQGNLADTGAVVIESAADINTLMLDSCTCLIRSITVKRMGQTSKDTAALYVTRGFADIRNINITAEEPQEYAGASGFIAHCAVVVFYEGTNSSISSMGRAIRALGGAYIVCHNVGGTDNKVGLYATSSIIVASGTMLGAATPAGKSTGSQISINSAWI